MNIATDPYEILGIRENADIEECTDAYKKLAKKYHPDLNPNDAIAREAMKEINRAYDTIKKSANKSYCDESQSATDAAKAQKSNNYSTQKALRIIRKNRKTTPLQITTPRTIQPKRKIQTQAITLRAKHFQYTFTQTTTKINTEHILYFHLHYLPAAYIYCLNMLLNIALTKI